MNILLIVQVEGSRERNILLDKTTFIIGRDKDCDLVLPDALVSRKHTKILRHQQDYYMVDMGSRNGTRLNGSPSAPDMPRKLRNGDEIQVGETRILFVDTSFETIDLRHLREEILFNQALLQQQTEPAQSSDAQPAKDLLLKAFLSHSSADDRFTSQLGTDLLLRAKIATWIDHENIGGGDNWDVKIREALQVSSAMIVVLTPEAVKSNNVKVEWYSFLQQNKPVFPILHQKCEVPLQLTFVQLIDFTQNYERGLTELIAAFRKNG